MVNLEFPKCCIMDISTDGTITEFVASAYGRSVRVIYDEFLYEAIIIVDDREKHVYRQNKIVLANGFLRRYFERAKQDYEKQKETAQRAFKKQINIAESTVVNELYKIMGIK